MVAGCTTNPPHFWHLSQTICINGTSSISTGCTSCTGTHLAKVRRVAPLALGRSKLLPLATQKPTIITNRYAVAPYTPPAENRVRRQKSTACWPRPSCRISAITCQENEIWLKQDAKGHPDCDHGTGYPAGAIELHHLHHAPGAGPLVGTLSRSRATGCCMTCRIGAPAPGCSGIQLREFSLGPAQRRLGLYTSPPSPTAQPLCGGRFS